MARISPRRKRAKVLLDEDIGWLIHEYEHAYPNEEEGQGPFGYLLKGATVLPVKRRFAAMSVYLAISR